MANNGGFSAWDIGYDDGINGFVAQPFEGWNTLPEIFAYLRGYYAGKEYRKLFGIGY